MATKQKPIHHIRINNVRASIWEQSSDKGPFLMVNFSRSYKNVQGQWKNTYSYTESTLEALINCAIEVLEWMRRHRQSSKGAA